MGIKDQKRPDMYQKEFARQLAFNAGISQSEAESMTEVFLATLTDALKSEQSVCFPEFGVFELHATTERMGRNPKTMEDHVIPAGYKPVFRASRAFRETVNDLRKRREEILQKAEKADDDEGGEANEG